MTRNERFVKERNEVLRSLDIEKFEQFWAKWKQPRPGGGWASPEVPLIMMHKVRLQVPSMTETERAESRAWLLIRGYDLEIKDHL